jgi:hypothetical protein
MGLLLHAARMSSAAFARTVWPRGRKVRGVSSQRMTNMRADGGVLGDVAALMVADPKHAHDVIEHLRSFLPRPSQRPLVELILAGQRSDSAEDIARTEALADMTPEKLAAYRDSLRAAIADAQRLLDAVNQQLQERGEG